MRATVQSEFDLYRASSFMDFMSGVEIYVREEEDYRRILELTTALFR